jgi:chloramphenicol 3-O-phosphotransferase
MKKLFVFLLVLTNAMSAMDNFSKEGPIVILTGHSCAGKSSIYKEILRQMPGVTGISLDEFMQKDFKIPYYSLNKADKYGQSNLDNPAEIFAYHIRHKIQKSPHSPYIIEHVLANVAIMNQLLKNLELFRKRVVFVKIFCPFAIAQARLEQRNASGISEQKRSPALVKLHFGEFLDAKGIHILGCLYSTHNPNKFDLSFDTSMSSSKNIADRIRSIMYILEPTAFTENYKINQEIEFEKIKQKFLAEKRAEKNKFTAFLHYRLSP